MKARDLMMIAVLATAGTFVTAPPATFGAEAIVQDTGGAASGDATDKTAKKGKKGKKGGKTDTTATPDSK